MVKETRALPLAMKAMTDIMSAIDETALWCSEASDMYGKIHGEG
jgi:hypothetical protein